MLVLVLVLVLVLGCGLVVELRVKVFCAWLWHGASLWKGASYACQKRREREVWK